MPNIVPFTEKSSSYLWIGESIKLPLIPVFEGLQHFPPWIHFWRETQQAFDHLGESEAGDISVSPCVCDCGFGKYRGWDMNPVDMLHFAHPDRTTSNSWLSLGEVVVVLCYDRFRSLEDYFPSPLYFIVPGWGARPYLLEVRRTNRHGYVVDYSREITAKSRIPRLQPLYIPNRPRQGIYGR